MDKALCRIDAYRKEPVIQVPSMEAPPSGARQMLQSVMSEDARWHLLTRQAFRHWISELDEEIRKRLREVARMREEREELQRMLRDLPMPAAP